MAISRTQRPDEGRPGRPGQPQKGKAESLAEALEAGLSMPGVGVGSMASRAAGAASKVMGGDVPGMARQALRRAISGNVTPFNRFWSTARNLVRQGKLSPETAERATEIEMGPLGSTSRDRAFIELLEQELPRTNFRKANAAGLAAPYPGLTPKTKQMLRLMMEGEPDVAERAMRSLPRSPN